MLKWTVGRRSSSSSSSQAGGVSGCGGGGGVASATSAALGPCLNLRRAAAKLQHRRADKENALPLQTPLHGDSPKTPASAGRRDSFYMRLDALPAVLRDVSNHIASATTPNSGGAAKHNTHIEYR